MAKNPTLVLAGSHREYLDYIKNQGATNPRDPRWVSGVNHNNTLGHHFATIVTTGTFWYTTDAEERFHLAQAQVWPTLKQETKMQSGEIRKLPKSSSPMFTDQWAYQGTAKAPYIVSCMRNGYAIEQQKAQEWRCSCKSWTTTVPRQNCKHIIAIKLKEGLLKDVTPIDWKPLNPAKPHGPLIKIPKSGGVVISEEEHEAYKKFLAARGTRKAGNNFDEEGRRFRP